MKKVSSLAVAEAAEAALRRKTPILYSQEDCQAFVENTVRRAGGDMGDYRGSNDMYRNACDKIMTLEDARIEGVIMPGTVLFIVEQDGGEPGRYKADGLGNASHIGIYSGGQYEVVHSSASRGRVAASTLENGWTHIGWLKAVDYYDDLPDGEEPSFDVDYSGATNLPKEGADTMIGYINLPTDSNVKFRISPSSDSQWYGRINGGEQVDVLSDSGEWTRVKYGGKDGYVMSKFITTDPSAQPDPMPPGVADVDEAALLTELEGLNRRQAVIIAALKGVM